jgi:hypothetical protein
LVLFSPSFVLAFAGTALLRHDWKIRQLTQQLIKIEIKIVRGFVQIKSGIFYGGTLLCGVGKNFLKQIG